MTGSGCIFCDIVEGRAPAHVVWEAPAAEAELRAAAGRLRAALTST